MGCGVSEREDGVSEWDVFANGYRKREERVELWNSERIVDL